MARSFYTMVQRQPGRQPLSPSTPPTQKFILFTIGTRADDQIIDFFRSLSFILLHGRLFDPIEPAFFYHRPPDWSCDTRDEDPESFIRHALAAAPADHNAVGFVATSDDVLCRKKLFQSLLQNREYRAIICCGESVEAAVASLCESEANVKDDGQKSPFSAIEVQKRVHKFQDTIQFLLKWKRNSDTLIISVKDIQNHNTRVIFDLHQFFGVNSITLSENEGGNTLLWKADDVWPLLMRTTDQATFLEILYAFNHEVVRQSRCMESSRMAPSHRAPSPTSGKAPRKWGILIPTRSRNGKFNIDGLNALLKSLDETVSSLDLHHITLYLGVDQDDEASRNASDYSKLYSLKTRCIVKMMSLYEKRGYLCHMWNAMAMKCIKDGNDFCVLLGDTVTLRSHQWKQSIEKKFFSIGEQTGLSYGVACVAFADVSFPNFPKFPVLHKTHIHMYGGVLPSRFINHGGVSFLFELYSRIGATVIDENAQVRSSAVCNTDLGYEKRMVRYKGSLLTSALSTLQRSVGMRKIQTSLTVVVPSFYSNMGTIEEIINLRVSYPCRVRFLIVLENGNDDEIRKFQDKFDGHSSGGNYFVDTVVQPRNLGTYAARNTGLMYSDADWVIFLADHARPSRDVLDAYLAATIRHPEARILAGQTSFPPAMNACQRGLGLSEVLLFYRMSERFRFPPWCVCSNVCVKGRMQGQDMFDLGFARLGFGADVEYCMRVKQRAEDIISVKDAHVQHYWIGRSVSNTLMYVIRSTIGDSRCVESMEEKTFIVLPGWHECILLGAFPAWFYNMFVLFTLMVTGLELCYQILYYLKQAVQRYGLWHGWTASVFTSGMVMCQDLARMCCHLKRGRWDVLCHRFDWYDGQDPLLVQWRQREHALKFFGYCILLFLMCTNMFPDLSEIL